MPFYLKAKDNLSELKNYKSVLIIPCRFCPAASSAVSNDNPYIELFQKFLKTDSYEKYIKDLKSNLEKRGLIADVFESKLLHQFVLCMWSKKRRKKLSDITQNYDALLVLGCEGAVRTVKDSLNSSAAKILQGLETEGLMSIQPKFYFPCNLSLKLESITPLSLQDS